MDDQKVKKSWDAASWEDAIATVAKDFQEKIDNDIVNQLFEESKEQLGDNLAKITWDPSSYIIDTGIDALGDSGDMLIANDDANWGTLSFATSHPVTALTIQEPNGDLVVEIKYTGEVTLGKNVSAEHAAHEFWSRLAQMGAQFEERTEELEAELEDEQDMRLELEEIVSDIANALGAPQATEHDLADIAAKMCEELEAAKVLIAQHHLHNNAPEQDFNPEEAYRRAMKVVR